MHHFKERITKTFIQFSAKTSSADEAAKHAESLKKMYQNDFVQKEMEMGNIVVISNEGDNVIIGAEIVLPMSYKVRRLGLDKIP